MARSDPTLTIDALAAKLDLLIERTAHSDRRYFSIVNAAAYADLSPESIRRLLSSGKLTPLRPVKGRVLVDRLELDSVILSATQRPRSGRGLNR